MKKKSEFLRRVSGCGQKMYNSCSLEQICSFLENRFPGDVYLCGKAPTHARAKDQSLENSTPFGTARVDLEFLLPTFCPGTCGHRLPPESWATLSLACLDSKIHVKIRPLQTDRQETTRLLLTSVRLKFYVVLLVLK